MAEHRARDVDPVTLEVVRNRLFNIAQEMGGYLRRTALAPVIKYADDFSTGLFTWDGRLIAQGRFEPAFLGCMPTVLNEIFAEYYPPEEWEPGDVVLTNDPYIGAGHFLDVFLFEPIFADGTLVGFTVDVANHTDIGGRAPSKAIDAESWYEEGLHIPPVKLYENGTLQEGIMRTILTNVRESETVEADIDAQRAASELGKRRYRKLVEEHGFEKIQPYMEEILDRSEAKMRTAIRRIPDGSYEFEERLDGIDEPLPIHVEVTVDDDELHLDYAGTADQLDDRPLNSTWSFTYANSMYAVKAALDLDTSNTGSANAPITMSVPERSLLNPEPPAPLDQRAEVLNHIVSAVFGALGEAGFELPAAGAQKYHYRYIYKHPETGRRLGQLVDLNFSAAGGRPDGDGEPAVGGVQNLKNTPVEVIEAQFPMRVDRYELLADTSGAGTHRGGSATIRERTFLTPTEIQSGCERFAFGPYGVRGGEPGVPGRAILNPESDDPIDVGPHDSIRVETDDTLVTYSAGGGGYGDPEARPERLVRRDVANGLVSPGTAREVYGVDVDVEPAPDFGSR